VRPDVEARHEDEPVLGLDRDGVLVRHLAAELPRLGVDATWNVMLVRGSYTYRSDLARSKRRLRVG
jgi:hypothetical protein